jgi:hypothetical protein
MIIKVEQQDIDKGVPENCNSCAIAVALMRNLGATKVMVTVDDYTDSTDTLEDTPQFNIDGQIYDADSFTKRGDIHEFIQDFDTGLTVSPFEFELDLDRGFADDRQAK